MEKGSEENLTFLVPVEVCPSRGMADREAAYERKRRRESRPSC